MSGLSLLAALKAFDATARAGSMTAAAKVLALQQPTVSAHIQRLESEYGVELFHRRGRRLELTSFGRTLLDYTRRTFSGEEDAHALLAADGFEDGVVGSVERERALGVGRPLRR